MIIDPGSLKEDVRALLLRKNTVVQIEDGTVIVDLGSGQPYEIPLNEVKSNAAILQWVLHICSKKGADTVIIEAFISKMQSHLASQ